MEVCVENVESARNACIGGASRIELCSNLKLGGLTPSEELFNSVKAISTIPVFVMLRPNASENFIYDENEMNIIKNDMILKFKNADGFVFGALTPQGLIDEEKCSDVIKWSEDKPVTFHRAFDVAKMNHIDAAEIIIKLGFTRILTSGMNQDIMKGIDVIKDLVNFSTNKSIIIMPGGGITLDNIKRILEQTKASEFHGSASKIIDKTIKITSALLVRNMVDIFCSVNNQKYKLLATFVDSDD